MRKQPLEPDAAVSMAEASRSAGWKTTAACIAPRSKQRSDIRLKAHGNAMQHGKGWICASILDFRKRLSEQPAASETCFRVIPFSKTSVLKPSAYPDLSGSRQLCPWRLEVRPGSRHRRLLVRGTSPFGLVEADQIRIRGDSAGFANVRTPKWSGRIPRNFTMRLTLSIREQKIQVT